MSSCPFVPERALLLDQLARIAAAIAGVAEVDADIGHRLNLLVGNFDYPAILGLLEQSAEGERTI